MTHSKNFSTGVCVMPTWEVTSKWLSTTAASQPWWELVGAQLATLAHNAQYSPEKQLEVILFFYTQVAPSLGKLQTPADPGWETRWRSLLTNDGSPVEHSWKWNADGSHGPEVRYCIEAIGPQTGTSSDPYNYLATEALVEQLVPLLPAMDLTWFYKLADTLQISRCQPATKNPEAPPSSTFIAFEHVAEGIVPKVYFLPACDPESQGPPTFTTFENAIRAAVGERIEAADAVFEYVSSDPIGRTMSPDMLAIDCVDPAKSRLKLYASSSEASLESIVSIMSLGQRIQNIGKGVEELKLLLPLLLGESASDPAGIDFGIKQAFDESLAHPFDLYGRFTYYFDVAPGSALPTVKLYVPALRFGSSDESVAAGLCKYLELKNRGQHVEGFRKTLNQFSELNREEGHRFQTYIAVAFQKDGSLALTSYLNPGIYRSL